MNIYSMYFVESTCLISTKILNCRYMVHLLFTVSRIEFYVFFYRVINFHYSVSIKYFYFQHFTNDLPTSDLNPRFFNSLYRNDSNPETLARSTALNKKMILFNFKIIPYDCSDTILMHNT